MTFNSLWFVLFFTAVFGGVCLLRRRLNARNIFLLLASWLFYGLWGWHWFLLLLGTQAFDYSFARIIQSLPTGDWRRKACVIGSCTVNLAVLGVFKYGNFAIDNYIAIAHWAGHDMIRPMLNIVQPVGISFYTFQSMSYVIDVYRGHLKAERHPLHYALFVAFFPQLVAGPIERATHLLPQIKSPSRINWDNIYRGFWLISIGMFKKVVLADNISIVTKAVFDIHDVAPRPWESMIGIYAFAIQIYCDFSAYSDIARGCARMMGFDLMRNFDLPYFAVNPSDFWRRWHISLSTWLRDYLYIPLGGNRGGVISTYRNLFLTMLIGGLWHGATWLYVLWGAYHGAMLCIHRAAKPLLDRFFTFKTIAANRAWTFVRIIVFFQFTCLGWLLFRGGPQSDWTPDMLAESAFTNVKRLLLITDLQHSKPLLTANQLLIFFSIALLLLVAQLIKYLKDDHNIIFRMPAPARAAVYAGIILGILIFGEFGGGDFIYFQF